MANRQIIIAEDNPRDREFLRDALPSYDIIFTTNGAEAIDAASDIQEPWIISDLQMPQINGIQLAETLWEHKPLSRIIFWTQHKDEIYIRSLAAIIPPETVYGYILKSNPSAVLETAVNSVFLECQCWIDQALLPVQARASTPHQGINDLEYEVLIDIALGLTDNTIAQRRYLSRRGVQSRLKSLYAKLDIDQEQFSLEKTGEVMNMRSRAISIAMRRGLLNPYELQQEEEILQSWLEKIKKKAR